jgi:hypothetical protein
MVTKEKVKYLLDRVDQIRIMGLLGPEDKALSKKELTKIQNEALRLVSVTVTRLDSRIEAVLALLARRYENGPSRSDEERLMKLLS